MYRIKTYNKISKVGLQVFDDKYTVDEILNSSSLYSYATAFFKPFKADKVLGNTYYVAHDVTYMQTYLREHVNPSAHAFEVGKIDDVTIWKFIVNENTVSYTD